MKRTIVFLPITLAAVLYSPATQAQTPAAPAQATSDGVTIQTPDAPVPNAQIAPPPEGSSNIRIVRLSLANGKVTMDRNTGLGFEPAFNNLPITQGSRLQTGEGAAEVEFEDGTTLRLVPQTRVDFTQLYRTPAGTTISSMQVVDGTVYVSLAKTKGNTFTLTSADGTITPRPGAHLRLEARNPESRLSVITGNVDFKNPAGLQEVGKMKSLIFNSATHAPADLIAGIEDAPFDNWDQNQSEYHAQYAHGNALAGSGNVFGLNDLNYYGYFSNVDGCGRLWRPYFVSAAWDPYSNGIWAWYSGAGYSWVSPYPWGWAPFHYGSWMQCGAGWGWQPGGDWYGLTRGHLPHHDHDGDHHHHRGPEHPIPPHPRPNPGHVNSLVAVNNKPLPFSHADLSTRAFVLRNDSAGLGIARGEFGKLNKLSTEAVRSGSATVPIIPVSSSGAEMRAMNGFSSRDRYGARQTATATHEGYFRRPGAVGNESHINTSYRTTTASNASDSNHGDHHGSEGAAATHPTPGSYPSSAAHTGGSYSAGSNGYAGESRASGAGGYSGNGHSSGSYSGGGGGYSSSAHSGGSYSGGGGGYSSGGRSGGGGGFSGGGGGGGYSGGSHASAPAVSSAPAPAASAPSAAPAASAPSGGRR